MAKSFRHLWPAVVSWENLLRAYHTCRRRKRYRQPATEFDFAWEENLFQLQQDLISGVYEHGLYHHFHISDPKPRLISAAPFRDRIVHHAVVRVLEPIFEQRFIHDSYACRIGKGTHRAIKRAQYYQRRHPWCLQTDIVKFFPSIDHEKLLITIRSRVNDNQMMELIGTILKSGTELPEKMSAIRYFAGDDLFAPLRPHGLPIGNLTSQFFANVFLDPLDHYIKEDLRIPGYVRYADDLLLFANTKLELTDAVEHIQQRLSRMRLRIHRHKTHFQPTRQAMTYLGFRVSPNELRLSQQGIRRFIKRSRRQKYLFKLRQITIPQLTASAKAWAAHVRGTNSSTLKNLLFHEHAKFAR